MVIQRKKQGLRTWGEGKKEVWIITGRRDQEVIERIRKVLVEKENVNVDPRIQVQET